METWDAARTVCQRYSGDLVSITSHSIQTFLQSECNSGVYWIGLNDKRTEGTFVWLDGVLPSLYTNWIPGEPNDHSGDEDCASAYLHEGGKWNDLNCLGLVLYICENDADIDECLSSPCLHGTCIDQLNSH
uniref:Low affinity immunoglobulin epsilon Fc receptor-like n=1 Tax=Crassostrea virginica TaxID=6565 RepID=A0A8B8AYJ6_CRAVI|nr:low affinity immunoglobulin epsilon Fc receptor-like [Crassostrea virginica]